MRKSKEPVFKSAGSTLSIGINWSFLTVTDNISTSVWTCDDPDIVISRNQISGTVTSCLISGGVTGKRYKVYNTIETDGDLVDKRYFVIVIQDTQV